MGHLSKTELNLTYFYKNPNFLLALWKYLAGLNQKQLESLKKSTFWWSCAGKKYLAPEDPIYLYLGQMYVNMMSSKGVRTRHHIRRFLRRSLVPKIHTNTGETPGTTAEGKKKSMAKSEGRDFLTVDTLKTLYCCIDIPWFRVNPTHFVTKLEIRKLQ